MRGFDADEMARRAATGVKVFLLLFVISIASLVGVGFIVGSSTCG